MKQNEIILRIPEKIHKQILSDLKRAHSFALERIGFISSNHKVLKNGNVIILITEYFPVKDEHYINDPEVGARINSDAIREALQRILDSKVGCFHVHYHSFSSNKPEFSGTDLKDNPEIIKAFKYADKSQFHGMIVLGKSGINALVYLSQKDTWVPVTKTIVVGYPMGLNIEVKKHIKVDLKRFDRQSFLGKNSQYLFGKIKIAIVGLGGGGSHIVQQLAYLGIKNYVLFDFDIVSDTNLNRMIGAGVIDVDNRERKCNIAERTIKYIIPDASVISIYDNWKNMPELIQECDIAIGCVDSYAERRDLELECRRYLIPFIDIGMDVYKGFKKEPPSMVGQIILSFPGKPCMRCLGFLTDENLAREAAKYGAAGGRPQVVWSNGVLASQAVGILVDLITGWSGQKDIVPYYAFDGNLGTLTNHPRLKYIPEQCEHFKLKDVGPPKFRKL